MEAVELKWSDYFSVYCCLNVVKAEGVSKASCDLICKPLRDLVQQRRRKCHDCTVQKAEIRGAVGDLILFFKGTEIVLRLFLLLSRVLEQLLKPNRKPGRCQRESVDEQRVLMELFYICWQ